MARSNLKAPLFAALGMTMLAACDGGIGVNTALAIAGTSFVINEDKLPTDVIAEAVTGLDCNSIRKQQDKGPLCRPPRQEIIEAPVYCYKTLAKIDCFERPNPYGYQQRTIN